jgi:hypothetical protein
MGANAPSQLTQDQIDQVSQVVKDPKFDIYVGKEDDKIRRLAVSVDFEIPSDARAQFQGAEGGTLSFSIDFAKVGEPKTITPPANAQPIADLQEQLGGLFGGGVPGASGGSGSSGSGGSGSSGSGGSGSSGGTNPTPAQFEKYSKCLQNADPSDTAAIQQCAKLLK